MKQHFDIYFFSRYVQFNKDKMPKMILEKTHIFREFDLFSVSRYWMLVPTNQSSKQRKVEFKVTAFES